ETSTPPTVPFEPRSLKINEVVLQAVGADANLTGDLTFADLEQPPVGVIEGDFKGINALLDKLVAMGIVPQDQLMGARMMLAMFGQPAEGDPDHLQTKIEFADAGSIFASGQQVEQPAVREARAGRFCPAFSFASRLRRYVRSRTWNRYSPCPKMPRGAKSRVFAMNRPCKA